MHATSSIVTSAGEAWPGVAGARLVAFVVSPRRARGDYPAGLGGRRKWGVRRAVNELLQVFAERTLPAKQDGGLR